MDKRGQFYLLAAVIIILVIIGFAVISNYSRIKTPIKIYNLGEELEIESSKVLDYGTYNEESVDMEELLENFTKVYSEYAREGIEMYFIFGEESNLVAYKYVEGARETMPFESGGGKVNITVNEIVYEFELNLGENFYFVISQDIGGEQHVVTN